MSKRINEIAIAYADVYKELKSEHDRVLIKRITIQQALSGGRITKVLKHRHKMLEKVGHGELQCSAYPKMTPHELSLVAAELPNNGSRFPKNLTILRADGSISILHRGGNETKGRCWYVEHRFAISRDLVASLKTIVWTKLTSLKLRKNLRNTMFDNVLAMFFAPLVLTAPLVDTPPLNVISSQSTVVDGCSEDDVPLSQQQEKCLEQFARELKAPEFRDAVIATLSKKQIIVNPLTEQYRHALLGGDPVTVQSLNEYFKRTAGQRFTDEDMKTIAEGIRHFRDQLGGLYYCATEPVLCNLTVAPVKKRQNKLHFCVYASGQPRAGTLTQRLTFPENLQIRLA